MILNLLQRLAGVAIAIVLAVVALIFASVVFALAAAIALVLGGWLWWHTRDLRREVERRAHETPPGGTTIEGEYRRLDER
jgi:hypothetical protein